MNFERSILWRAGLTMSTDDDQLVEGMKSLVEVKSWTIESLVVDSLLNRDVSKENTHEVQMILEILTQQSD